ncbi:hypothetical protein BHE74_00021871 [Ensete ventricosum]|nr:hypothetical protein GW17_00013862 [Ensete ventricosum]RWW70448.1 hypothetical protein BHE74_00021871 [Ensete ventricosum]RZR88195.1 hypothetical protein BHM03_00015724 [Ensete ventricosum]
MVRPTYGPEGHSKDSRTAERISRRGLPLSSHNEKGKKDGGFFTAGEAEDGAWVEVLLVFVGLMADFAFGSTDSELVLSELK